MASSEALLQGEEDALHLWRRFGGVNCKLVGQSFDGNFPLELTAAAATQQPSAETPHSPPATHLFQQQTQKQVHVPGNSH